MEILARLQSVAAITNEAEHQAAGELWKEGREALKAIDLQHADGIDFAHKEHMFRISERDKVKKPIEEAAKKVKGLMAVYQDECRRKAAAEARKLEAVARAWVCERKLQEAIAAEAAGGKAEADAILEEEIMLPPVAVAPAPKVEGVVFRTAWKFRVVDAALVPREYLAVDEVRLGAVVRATKGSLKIPGVEIYPEKV